MARTGRPETADNRINVSVGMRVYPSVYAQLRQRARNEDRSIASLVGSLVESGMKEESKV